MYALRAPSLELCRSLPRVSGVDERFAERVLTRLCRDEGARWLVLGEGGPLLAGAVIDTCASADNIADLFPVSGDPAALSWAQIDGLLALAETIAKEGPRDGLEVALTPDRVGWQPVIEARGYALAYTLHRMERPPEAVTEPTLPDGLHWEPFSLARGPDLHEAVLRAFSEIPGAMVPEQAEFLASMARATPPAWLLCAGARVAGYARVTVEEDGVDIASLGRHPDFRGQGLGEPLIGRALRAALELAPARITLTVAAKNQRALRLYERHGFRTFEEIRVYRIPVQGARDG